MCQRTIAKSTGVNGLLPLFMAHALCGLLEIVMLGTAIGFGGSRVFVLVVCLVGRHLEAMDEANVTMSN